MCSRKEISAETFYAPVAYLEYPVLSTTKHMRVMKFFDDDGIKRLYYALQMHTVSSGISLSFRSFVHLYQTRDYLFYNYEPYPATQLKKITNLIF